MPKFVDHTYQDFSRYIEEGGQLCKHKKSGNNFPARLHRILSDAEHSHLITWMPHGRAWRIIDRERLVREVIPKYFSSSKYHSFCRQLNWWGFKRLCGPGPDMGCYYHQCFLRDLPQLTCLIRRTTTNDGRLKPNIDSEPNLYMISKERPLPMKVNFLLAPHCSEEAAPTNKFRAISHDDTPETPALVQHVVSTSSFMPENSHAHEFTAQAGSSVAEEMALESWASSITSSSQGRHDGYHHYPSCHYFPSGYHAQHPPPPSQPHPFPPCVTDQQGLWVPQDKSYYNADSVAGSDTKALYHGDSMIDDHGWKQLSPEPSIYPNFITEPSSGIIDDNYSVFQQDNEHFDHSNDPYAPLPAVEVYHHRHPHLHDEKCSMEGWIDGCLSVLKVVETNDSIDGDCCGLPVE